MINQRQSEKKARVNILVTCWNGFEYSKLTIERIIQTTKIPYYLTIVDNFSIDGTREYLEGLRVNNKYCKNMTVILNNKNIGAGSAHNQGWHLSNFFNAEFTCFCDNDVYFWDGWIDSMLGKMDADESIGAISPLRISKNTKHYVGNDSKTYFETTPTGLTPNQELEYFFNSNKIEYGVKRLININGGGLKEFSQIPASMPAHCLLVRGKVLNSIGFAADPIYKKYGSDDIDLCWEVLQKGYKIAVDKDTYVHHFRHKSVISGKLDREKILRDNNMLFANKWQLEIENLRADDRFDNKINDKNNESYSILRHMSLPTSPRDQQSSVFAVWGCLGKTYFCNKYSNLAVDLDSSRYQYAYEDEVKDLEVMKGLPNRKINPKYPKNYAVDVKNCIGKYKYIFVAIAPEMFEELERLGIKYSIVYPKFSRKEIILNDARRRGNNLHFVQKLESILSSKEELTRLKKTRKYEKMYFLDDDVYLEDLIKCIAASYHERYC